MADDVRRDFKLANGFRFGVVDVAGENLLGDGAGKETRPEAAAVGNGAKRLRHAFAQAIGKPGKIAEGGRQHRLDAGADVAGENRGDAFAADGDGERGAVDDRRRVEIAHLGAVDDVDRHAGFAGERPDLAVALLAAGGGEDQRGAGKVGGDGTRPAPVAVGGDQIGTGFLFQRRGEDDDIGPGLGEQPDLGGGLTATADDHDPATGDLVEGREDGELAGGVGHDFDLFRWRPLRGSQGRSERVRCQGERAKQMQCLSCCEHLRSRRLSRHAARFNLGGRGGKTFRPGALLRNRAAKREFGNLVQLGRDLRPGHKTGREWGPGRVSPSRLCRRMLRPRRGEPCHRQVCRRSRGPRPLTPGKAR